MTTDNLRFPAFRFGILEQSISEDRAKLLPEEDFVISLGYDLDILFSTDGEICIGSYYQEKIQSFEDLPSEKQEWIKRKFAQDSNFLIPDDCKDVTKFILADVTREIIRSLALDVTQKEQHRRQRPADLANLLPISHPIRLWTQSHLTGIMLDVHASKDPSEWTYHDGINGFYLETRHGRAIIHNVQNANALKMILDKLGPEALQYEIAALCQIEEKERRKHGELPSFENVTPTKLGVSDLLRSMGKRPDGNTFSREQQMKPRNYIQTASMINYFDIKPTYKGSVKMNVGPMLVVLNTGVEKKLPFEGIPSGDEVISITVMPGEMAWKMIKDGLSWCHPKLLEYHPNRNKYEIAIGFYLLQLQVNRRKKDAQEYVSLGTIERESGACKWDSDNEYRRMQRIEKALHRLVSDKVIGGVDGKAVIETDSKEKGSAAKGARLKVADELRSQRLKLLPGEAIPALQKREMPKPKKNNTSKQPRKDGGLLV